MEIPPIALTVLIIGGLVWFLATREWRFKDDMIAKAGSWAYALGLFFWLWSVAK